MSWGWVSHMNSLKSVKSSVWLGPITIRQGMQNSSQATLLLLSSFSSSLCFHSCCLDFSLPVGRPSLLLLVWIPDHWCPCCSLRFWACFLLGTLDTSLTFLPLLDFKVSGFVYDLIQHFRVLRLFFNYQVIPTTWLWLLWTVCTLVLNWSLASQLSFSMLICQPSSRSLDHTDSSSPALHLPRLLRFPPSTAWAHGAHRWWPSSKLAAHSYLAKQPTN